MFDNTNLILTSQVGEQAAVNASEDISSASSHDQLFDVAWLKNARDNEPSLESLPWAEFVRIFGFHWESGNKDGPAWCPALFKADSLRRNDNVVSISMTVADIDDGTPVEVFEKSLAGLAYLIHTSYSHTKDKPKYRVIVPLLRAVPANVWPGMWRGFQDSIFQGHIDPSTKDASRLYYRPSHPVGAPDHFVLVGKGEFFDPNAIAVKPEPGAIAKTAKVIPIVPVAFEAGVLPKPTSEFGPVPERCQFLQWTSDPKNQDKVSEPLWYAMVSNAARFDGNEQWIHQASQHHPEYDEKRH